MASKKKKAKKLAKKMAKQSAGKGTRTRKKYIKRTDTWKKKDWYTVIAPKMFDEKEMIETPALKPHQLEGRVLNIPLREFTNKMQHQYTLLKFKINEIKGKTAYTEPIGFEVMRDSLRRNIRRRRSIIKTILNLKTKDNRKIRMTTYVFTASKIDTLKQKELRKVLDERIKDQVPEIAYNKLFEKVIYGEFASGLYKELKKLQRIKRVEVTKIKVLS